MAVATAFRLQGLFGEINHAVFMPPHEPFGIVFGPNGVGKTKLFEVIHAQMSLNVSKLGQIPFRVSTISFDDGSTFSVERLEEPDETRLLFRLSTPYTDEPMSWHGSLSDRTRYWPPSWTDLGNGYWVDRTDGETLEESEFHARYGLGEHQSQAVPELATRFLGEQETYLIETQRLINRAMQARSPRGALQTQSQVTVSKYAEDLRGLLADALANNSRTTQQLDRSFPRRLLESQNPVATDDEIRKRYERQNRQRGRLAQLALIESEPDLPLPDEELEEWQRSVLWTYLKDTELKLGTFDDILSKVDLLEEIINKRFLRKNIAVNATDGLRIAASNSRNLIRPQDLSSGEQHELILFYDLLFRARRGSLVLIDEPEISLHIAWQREFLTDIAKVCEVSNVRVLVATHSPQIIGKWRARTTQLGGDDVWAEEAIDD